MFGSPFLRMGSMFAILLFTAACANHDRPVELSSQFAPPGGASWSYAAKASASAPCLVGLSEVRDTRSDVQSMGEIGGRAVRAEDAAAWVRSGFESLKEDTRLRLEDATRAGESRLILSVDLVRAYVASLRTAKNASVVVRVRYSRNGAQVEEKIFRGDVNGLNWASGDGEAQESLNQALKEVIAAVDQHVRMQCDAIGTASSQPLALQPAASQRESQSDLQAPR